MSEIYAAISRFLKAEDGPTSVEYCFMMGFILLVCIGAVTNLGTATDDLFARSYDSIS